MPNECLSSSVCWFQTNLPLAALLLRRVIIACCFRVAALSGNAVLAFHRAAIAPELNRIQLSAICRGGQSSKVIDLLAWRCLPLGHPSAASDACAVELISSSKRQCGKWQVSLKPALIMQNLENGKGYRPYCRVASFLFSKRSNFVIFHDCNFTVFWDFTQHFFEKIIQYLKVQRPAL